MATGELFVTRLQTIGFKIETTPGTTETLTNADYDILARDIALTLDVGENERRYAVGDADAFESVKGKRWANLSFTMDIAGSGSAIVPPKWFKVMRTCAWEQTIGSAGVQLLKRIGLLVTATCIVTLKEASSTPRGKKFTLSGVAGSATLHYDDSGEPARIDVALQGCIDDILDVAAGTTMPTPTGMDTTIPQSVLSSYVQFKGVRIPTNQFSVDFGNDTQPIRDIEDQTGYRHAANVDHNITAAVQPYFQLEATAPYAVQNFGITGMAAGKLEAMFGATGANGIGFRMNAQVITYGDLNSREGMDSSPLTFRGIRGVTGSEIAVIYQGTPVT